MVFNEQLTIWLHLCYYIEKLREDPLTYISCGSAGSEDMLCGLYRGAAQLACRIQV